MVETSTASLQPLPSGFTRDPTVGVLERLRVTKS